MERASPPSAPRGRYGFGTRPPARNWRSRGAGASGTLTSASDRAVRVVEAVTGKEVATLRGHEAAVSALAFSPDGARLLTGGDYPDTSVRLWRVNTGAQLEKMTGHTNKINGVAFSPDGKRIATVAS